MRSSLQSRIAFALGMVTVASTLLAALLSGVLLLRTHRQSVREHLQTAATSLVSLGISDYAELKDFDQLDSFIEDALQMERVDKIIRVYDASGKLVFSTVHQDYDRLPTRQPRPSDRPAFQTLEGEARQYESLIVPYQGERNRRRFYLEVVIPLPRYAQLFRSLWSEWAFLLALLIGVSLLISAGLAQKLVKPVQQIADQLENRDPMKIEDWQPVSLDEKGQYLRAIAEGINTMMERTREAVLRIRQISRFVAHEMRTPLTILQGEAEMVLSKPDAKQEDYARVLKSSLEETQRMSEIVNTVLQIGERERTMPLTHRMLFSLVDWIRENKLRWERAIGRRIFLKLPEGDEVTVRTDVELLYRLVENLIRNISDHTPLTASCSIAVENRPEGVVLSIMDKGPGLPETVIDSINLLGRSSKAAGIGLHLCYTIAEICHFQLHFSNRPEGGLRVDVAL